MISVGTYPVDYLINEAYSLLARLHSVKPFSMTMPMVRGAYISNNAMKGVTDLLEKGKKQLHTSITAFIQKAKTKNSNDDPQLLHKQFTLLKLRFNSILDQLDIFGDVLSQRAEHEVGIWLSGLDVLAEDGLAIAKSYFDSPPLMVFLERGHGAAIRRARTRLPGGDENPVAVIQIPRERMIGSGIASSLIHEVGHQCAELLDLTKSIRTAIDTKMQTAKNKEAYRYYSMWIPEIIADYWAIGQLGITSALGLAGVVTLPKYFQFRLDLDDPHPTPYARVQISCAFGNSLYPHSQWNKLWDLWKNFYPLEGLPSEKIQILQKIEEELPQFVELVNNHQPKSLKGKKLMTLFPLLERQPTQLQQYFQRWKNDPHIIDRAPPTLVFAIMGQAKADLLLEAADESRILRHQLREWAFNRN